jgi:chitinase
LYNKSTGVFVSYDDPASIQAKAVYLKQKGLAGAMIWELSADTTDTAMLEGLRAGLG